MSDAIVPKNPFSNAPLYRLVACDIKLLRHTDSKSRTIDDEEFESLKKSIKEDADFLRVRPPIVNTYPGREGIIIGGDKRTLAAEALGMTQIPVIFVKVDPVKENAWNKKDNHHNGKWNEIELNKELIVLRDANYNLESLGIAPKTLVGMMNFTGKIQSHKDDPNYKGTTPGKKGKAQAGMRIKCPNCDSEFTFVNEYEVVAAVKTPQNEKQ